MEIMHKGMWTGRRVLYLSVDAIRANPDQPRKYFEPEALRAACLALGGREIPMGELSFEIPLFDFLPVMVQFWSSDEEFPPVFKLMWDENTLQYLKFETVCYAAAFLTQRLRAKMEA